MRVGARSFTVETHAYAAAPIQARRLNCFSLISSVYLKASRFLRLSFSSALEECSGQIFPEPCYSSRQQVCHFPAAFLKMGNARFTMCAPCTAGFFQSVFLLILSPGRMNPSELLDMSVLTRVSASQRFAVRSWRI